MAVAWQHTKLLARLMGESRLMNHLDLTMTDECSLNLFERTA